MKNKKYSLVLYFLILCGMVGAQSSHIIWQIGEKDGKPDGFSLAPNAYQDFLKYDFGWEDRYYLIGQSTPQQDWSYILPGPADKWGGTSHTAGLRTHFLNILFRMQELPVSNDYKLIVDLVDTANELPPLFKVTINGKGWKFALPKGSGKETLTGNYEQVKGQTIEIPLNSKDLKVGGNEINMTTLEGSWLIFDAIRLEGPASASIQQPCEMAHVRSVQPANYELGTADVQPLLVDVERLSGTPRICVQLDKVTILNEVIEQGRYILEAPMPAVKSKKESTYTILIDDQLVEEGKVTRSTQKKVTAADYVDTRLGTAHSRWMIAPGPWMPFSMVKLSPDNQNAGWQAGYDPSFESIGTFSHIHEWTMGGLGIMPTNGPLKIKIGDQSELNKDPDGYRSAFDKQTEQAGLGYYSVDLTDYGIKAELTSTTRCGFQRYTYPKRKDSRIMIDLQIPCEYRYDILKAEVKQVGKRRIEGYSKQQSKYVWSKDADQDYTIWFVIEFDQDIQSFGGWINDQVIVKDVLSATDPKTFGCYVEFDTRRNQTVQVRSGISYVDLEGASKNLKEEVADPFGWDFNAVYTHNRDTWNDIFDRIQINSDDAREKKRFYTNMYRSYCRNTFSDVDGCWVDATEKIQQLKKPDDVALGCDAFWNTFWNLNQLWNLITPEWSSRWVRSQLAMYDANGWLAKGPAGMEYIPVMVGEHEIPLLVSAYQMGIRDYDTGKMFEAVEKMQTTPPARIGDGFAGNRDLESYLQYQFVPADKGRFSNTLEYSFDDWTVSQLAKALGKENEYKIFADRGTWWKNAIDSETGYARLRYSDGTWEKNFDPFKSGANHHYVEGNAWQLTYFVPQDVPALAQKIGVDNFITRLTWGFEASEPWRYNAPGDQYWDFPVVQGNQQSMHFAFLFNWVEQPWQTQKWSRSIIDRYYGYEVDNAYLGDEDQGQMSAWFVMAALGLFQTDGGCRVEPIYEIGSPLFKEVRIDLGKKYNRGETFTIKANNVSRINKYIQSARLNGKPLNSFSFPARELLKGGILELEMGNQPKQQWGVAPYTEK